MTLHCFSLGEIFPICKSSNTFCGFQNVLHARTFLTQKMIWLDICIWFCHTKLFCRCSLIHNLFHIRGWSNAGFKDCRLIHWILHEQKYFNHCFSLTQAIQPDLPRFYHTLRCSLSSWWSIFEILNYIYTYIHIYIYIYIYKP